MISSQRNIKLENQQKKIIDFSYFPTMHLYRWVHYEIPAKDKMCMEAKIVNPEWFIPEPATTVRKSGFGSDTL